MCDSDRNVVKCKNFGYSPHGIVGPMIYLSESCSSVEVSAALAVPFSLNQCTGRENLPSMVLRVLDCIQYLNIMNSLIVFCTCD